MIQREIDEFERKYCMASAEFMSKFEQGELADSQDCFEWWGLIKGLSAIEEEIKRAKAALAS